eukprot:2039874-Alexandrium_andersonii.AAC.1
MANNLDHRQSERTLPAIKSSHLVPSMISCRSSVRSGPEHSECTSSREGSLDRSRSSSIEQQA